jgi:hypothetical protein
MIKGYGYDRTHPKRNGTMRSSQEIKAEILSKCGATRQRPVAIPRSGVVVSAEVFQQKLKSRPPKVHPEGIQLVFWTEQPQSVKENTLIRKSRLREKIINRNIDRFVREEDLKRVSESWGVTITES